MDFFANTNNEADLCVCYQIPLGIIKAVVGLLCVSIAVLGQLFIWGVPRISERID